MKLRSITLALGLFCAPFAASATTVVIDFGTTGASATPLTTYSEDGFTFKFDLANSDAAAGAALFDTTCVGSAACGQDLDLTPNGNPGYTAGDDGVDGNILIRQEAGKSVPDDEASAGWIKLILDSDTPFYWLGASAVDDGTFDFRTQADGNLGSITLGENETGQLTFGTKSSLIEKGDWIRVRFSGSGGIDALVLESVTPVPVPAALPMLLGALGGLSYMARRRKTRTS